MKSSKFIVYVMISMLSLLSLCPATAQNNPYRFELQKDIKKHLQRYLYELGVVRDSIPPVFTLSEEEKKYRLGVSGFIIYAYSKFDHSG